MSEAMFVVGRLRRRPDAEEDDQACDEVEELSASEPTSPSKV